MTRPIHIGMMFGVCLAVLLAATGWVSVTVLRLEAAQVEGQEQGQREEKIRLALWRMDSFLTPLIVEESARPQDHYTAFHTPGRIYAKGIKPVEDVRIPSPLLTHVPTHVLIHFRLDMDGQLSSPQVPVGPERELAESGYASRESVEAAAARLEAFQGILNAAASPSNVTVQVRARIPAQPLAPLNNRDVLLLSCATFPSNTVPLVTLNGPLVAAQQRQQAQRASEPLGNLKASQIKSQVLESQEFLNSAERNARANVYQQAAQKEVPLGQHPLAADVGAKEGPVQPLWAGPALVLARRVTVSNRAGVQGAWLNWPHLKSALLGNIGDLFPGADLEPVVDTTARDDTRQLAALPVRLRVPAAAAVVIPAWTPIRASLAVAWFCVLMAAVAVAVLLHGTVSMSERRGAFVSAVTHELRTPLTTFKMYSEMLAEDMVPDAAKRAGYLRTLCSEANRLGHLVENVLAYARLERGSARSRVERVTLGELIGRVRERLAARAEQAGMRLEVDGDAEAMGTPVSVDVPAVEQILFNLVDNACRYAAPTADEKIIHLEAMPDARWAMLRVRDHGEGISAEMARRLFKPFSKSANEAAHTAPGVGLGLALCRRWSRRLRGDLKLDRSWQGGACFVLSLPLPRKESGS